MKQKILILFAILFVSFAYAEKTKRTSNKNSFSVKINLKGGHLAEVFLGCAEKATDKFDRDYDDMAPPPGINTGYTAFISPDNKFYLYKDIRPFSEVVIWNLYGKIFENKNIILNWDLKTLPENYTFSASLNSEDKNYDMKKIKKIKISKTDVLTITAKKKSEK
ncbi:MAG: hypothetical protein U9O87_04195 [Verrucomicrobiota bacterium]|nr:hypothetical protein [Verrucomicrobiota bacterium]